MKKLFGMTAMLLALGLSSSANAGLTQLGNLFVFGDSLSDGGNAAW
jgi:phospholipase/lecithinase/hemolysin